MPNVETEGYMGSYSTNSFQRINEEFINTILKSYCNKDKIVCSLGCYNDVLVDQIEYDKLFLVDKKFGDLKYEDNGFHFDGERFYRPKKEHKMITYFNCDIYYYLTECSKYMQKCDVVLMTNVAEHIEFMHLYRKIMPKIKNILKPNGYFICTFPNFRSVNRLVGTELGIIDTPTDLDGHDKKFGHVNPTEHWNIVEQIPRNSKLKLVQEIGIYFKPLAHSQMDKYFSDCLDTFIQIGYELGPRVCSYIGGVYKNS